MVGKSLSENSSVLTLKLGHRLSQEDRPLLPLALPVQIDLFRGYVGRFAKHVARFCRSVDTVEIAALFFLVFVTSPPSPLPKAVERFCSQQLANFLIREFFRISFGRDDLFRRGFDSNAFARSSLGLHWNAFPHCDAFLRLQYAGRCDHSKN